MKEGSWGPSRDGGALAVANRVPGGDGEQEASRGLLGFWRETLDRWRFYLVTYGQLGGKFPEEADFTFLHFIFYFIVQ